MVYLPPFQGDALPSYINMSKNASSAVVSAVSENTAMTPGQRLVELNRLVGVLSVDVPAALFITHFTRRHLVSEQEAQYPRLKAAIENIIEGAKHHPRHSIEPVHQIKDNLTDEDGDVHDVKELLRILTIFRESHWIVGAGAIVKEAFDAWISDVKRLHLLDRDTRYDILIRYTEVLYGLGAIY